MDTAHDRQNTNIFSKTKYFDALFDTFSGKRNGSLYEVRYRGNKACRFHFSPGVQLLFRVTQGVNGESKSRACCI